MLHVESQGDISYLFFFWHWVVWQCLHTFYWCVTCTRWLTGQDGVPLQKTAILLAGLLKQTIHLYNRNLFGCLKYLFFSVTITVGECLAVCRTRLQYRHHTHFTANWTMPLLYSCRKRSICHKARWTRGLSVGVQGWPPPTWRMPVTTLLRDWEHISLWLWMAELLLLVSI